MDSMEINKAVAALLVAGIAFSLSGLISESLVHETVLKKPVIAIEGAAPAPAGGPAPVVLPQIANLMASADVAAGESLSKKLCAACHSFNEGGANGVGPNLYGVLGAPHGHAAGFSYSAAIKGKEGPWTYAGLNEWLYKPAAYAPGTRMGFAGLPKAEDRANVIAYLRSLSKSPEPLPAPVAEAAAAAPAPGPSAAPSFAELVATADPARGKADTMKLACAACHSFNDGGANGIGPNLYGVVGSQPGNHNGYDFSSALKAKKGAWTVDELNAWLTKPATYAPGTKMAYPGVAKAEDRADIIAYLLSISPNAPKP